ncbi:MAG: hypothetical protein KGO02_15295, partial [Alphaproteobacteria bacterium]|nr:hypothetical protein [Alphaproteobacteria bacterium]
MSDRAWLAIEEQINAISFTQRLVKGKEVNFYFDKRRLLSTWLAPAPFDAWPIAVAMCHSGDLETPLRASVWIVYGRLFSIIFSRAPAPPWGGEFSVISVELIYDPLEARSESRTAMDDKAS